jgi:hypothetical protein
MQLGLMLKDGTMQRSNYTYPCLDEIDPLPDFVFGTDEKYHELGSYTRAVLKAYGGPCLTAGKSIEEWHEEIKPNKIRKIEKGSCGGFLWWNPYEEMHKKVEVWAYEDWGAKFWSFGFFHKGKCFHNINYVESPSYHSRLEFIRYVLASHDKRRWTNSKLSDNEYTFRLAESKEWNYTSLIARDSYISPNTIGVHTFIENQSIFDTDRMIPDHSSYYDSELPYRRFMYVAEAFDEGFARFVREHEIDSKTEEENRKKEKESKALESSLSSMREEIKRETESYVLKAIFTTLAAVGLIILSIKMG